ncbi:MAG TPA: hypothetical protein VES40_13835 [Ilumatobacteraceae bacterium]|nr:hypothetical protein [Ilumatobacteraceae bacterium]
MGPTQFVPLSMPSEHQTTSPEHAAATLAPIAPGCSTPTVATPVFPDPTPTDRVNEA